MTNQEIVHERHPNAVAKHFKPYYHAGRVGPIAGGWTIYPSETLDVHFLGNGATEEEAWASAAAGVLSVPPGRKRGE